MASQDVYRLISYSNENYDGDEFANSNEMMRIVKIVTFTPRTRTVTLQTRLTRCLDRGDMERNGKPSDEELLVTGSLTENKLFLIPRPPVNAATLKCDCGEYCRITPSRSRDNRNRLLAKCDRGNCRFRHWCDRAHIVCFCDRPAKQTIASKRAKPGNVGRTFYKCNKSADNNPCSYFKWEQDPDIFAYLDKDWGSSYMDVIEALLKYSETKTRFDDDFLVPTRVLSTLAAECSKSFEN